MISINESKVGNRLIVETSDTDIEAVIIEKPFYDPKKKIASA
jgi:aminomethyltransferase